MVLPLNFEVLIPKDDSVRLLNLILGGLDYRKLYRAFESKSTSSQPSLPEDVNSGSLPYMPVVSLYLVLWMFYACNENNYRLL